MKVCWEITMLYTVCIESDDLVSICLIVLCAHFGMQINNPLDV